METFTHRYILSLVTVISQPSSLDQQIKGLLPGGLAEKDGRLKIGDRLISVNGKHLEGLSKHDVVHLIDRAGDHLILLVRREVARSNPPHELNKAAAVVPERSQPPQPQPQLSPPPPQPQLSPAQRFPSETPPSLLSRPPPQRSPSQPLPTQLTPSVVLESHKLTDPLQLPDVPIMKPSVPSTPPPPASLITPQEVNRPGSLGPVPKGSRQDSCPFEIEVNKTALGLGLTLGMDETGMILVKSLTPKSPITKDGNIRCVCVCVCCVRVCGICMFVHTSECALLIMFSLLQGW